jgi:hypothetical protein
MICQNTWQPHSKTRRSKYDLRVSGLSLEQIRNLTDEEIRGLAMERPGHLGQYGFLLNSVFFRSQEHLAEAQHALLERLRKADIRP